MRRTRIHAGPFLAMLLITAAWSSAAAAQPEPSEEETEALKQLDAQIDGAVVYTRDGRVRKVTIGEWAIEDLGKGRWARWSRDGKHIAVYHDGRVHVMNADGSDRRELASGDHRDGCPIEFHADNQHIIYWQKSSGFWMVNIESGETEQMDLPATYTGEPGISADGERLAARWGNDLYAINLNDGTHHKYARGCSPGVSPNGERVMNNLGGHRRMDICDWNGDNPFTIDTRTAHPDSKWDNQHWSNHNDYIAAQGEGERGEAYVVRVSTNQLTRVTWEGDVLAPDLWVDLPKEKEKEGGEGQSDSRASAE